MKKKQKRYKYITVSFYNHPIKVERGTTLLKAVEDEMFKTVVHLENIKLIHKILLAGLK